MTLNDKLEVFFRERPYTWIDGKELAHIAGGYGWRSRCSDLRKRGLTIENRVRRVREKAHLPTTYAISEYRYVPADLFSETRA